MLICYYINKYGSLYILIFNLMADEPVNKETSVTSENITPEKTAIEKDIAGLEVELARKKAELSKGQESGPVKQKKMEAAIESIIEGQMPSSSIPVSSSTGAQVDEKDLSGEEKLNLHQLKRMDKESQLKFLISLSFKKGLDEGVKLARALNSPYLLDEYHDQLVDKFYKQLVESQKLEEL